MSEELTAWQRWCPFPEQWEPGLLAIGAHLAEPETLAGLDALDETETYPGAALAALHARGLGDQLADGPPPSGARVTPYQIAALSERLAGASLSLTVTAGVTQLALLPYYLAGDDRQRRWAFEKVRAGASGAMLLTEVDHGSNLLRNQARATRGVVATGGGFTEVAPGAPFTHYRLEGEKHFINGGREHALLTALLRTQDVGGAADFTFFGLERQAGVVAGERWKTLPLRAADISTVRLGGAVVPRTAVLGREGEGFGIAQKALVFGRAGPAAAAVALAHEACRQALDYARARDVYGGPIVGLGAITEHLVRMAALQAVAAAVSIKQTVMLNALGYGAAYYSAVGKFLAPRLAEEVVDEGRRVFSARAMLRKYPYERLGRDVLLLGIFDGTQHVMLNAVQAQLQRPHALSPDEALAAVRQAYATPPRPLVEVGRQPGFPTVVPLVPYFEALSGLPGALDAQPLRELAAALSSLCEALKGSGLWEGEQARRFEAAEIAAGLEGLTAVLELADPTRRAALGLHAARGGPEQAERDLSLARVAVGWCGARLVGRLRALALASGIEPAPGLGALEARLWSSQAGARQALATGFRAPAAAR